MARSLCLHIRVFPLLKFLQVWSNSFTSKLQQKLPIFELRREMFLQILFSRCFQVDWCICSEFVKLLKKFCVLHTLVIAGGAGSLAGCVRKEVCLGVERDFELSWGVASLLQSEPSQWGQECDPALSRCFSPTGWGYPCAHMYYCKLRLLLHTSTTHVYNKRLCSSHGNCV